MQCLDNVFMHILRGGRCACAVQCACNVCIKCLYKTLERGYMCVQCLYYICMPSWRLQCTTCMCNFCMIFVYQVRERLHLCAMFVHSNPSPFGFSSVGLFRGHCHKHSIHCCHLQKVNANLTVANIIIFLQSFVQIFNAVSHL